MDSNRNMIIDREIGKPDTRDPRTHRIIGAAMEVHRQLGPGFLEAVYQEALAIEFGLMDIPFRKDVDLPVRYKDQTLSCAFRADFVCEEDLLIDLRAIPELTKREFAQIINSMHATGSPVGLLINFGGTRLDFKRFVEPPKPSTKSDI